MNFLEFFIYNNFVNTKHDCHNYIKSYYSKVFSTKDRNNKYNILEIGVRTGSSLIMWNEWFNKSKIYGIDIDANPFDDETIKRTKIEFIQGNAYSKEILDIFEDNFFDYVMDDGPHTVDSQIYTINHWIKKLKHGGKIIIEDIGCHDYNGNPYTAEESLGFLLEAINKDICEYKVFDLRNEGQYDSIILELTKNELG